MGLLLDDFGTGFSSLSHLKRFPIDSVKIDRHFVSGLSSSGGSDDAIVAAIMGMASAMGLRAIGEGIEHEHQAARLGSLGCELGQGYHLGRPVGAAELDAIVSRQDRA